MSDNVNISPGSGKTVLADEVVDGTLGTGVSQYVKIMDGTIDSTNKWTVDANGRGLVYQPTLEDVTVLLQAILTRLDYLNAAIDKTYTPADSLGLH